MSMIPEERGLRLAAAVAGAVTLHFGWQFWALGRVYLHPEIAAVDFLVYGLAFGLIWLALVHAPRWRHWTGPLILVAALLTSGAGTYVWSRAVSRDYGTDVLAFEHYAARLVLRGVDPYSVSMRPAVREFHVPLATQTLTWDGRLVDRVSYPAGAFLIFVPFVALGVADLRWVVLAFHWAALCILYAGAPRATRPLVLLPVLASTELVEFTGSGVVDFPWVVALLLMLILERRPRASGACYGIACSLKQEPWFLAPFLIVYFLKDKAHLPLRARVANLVAFGATAGALFLAINAYFVAADPINWLLGTLEPALGNLIPLGQGPSTLIQLGVPIPASSLTVLAGALGVLLLLNYAVYFRRMRDLIWLFPALITWFMPRSLHNYFVFWIPAIALAVARHGLAEDTTVDDG